MNEPNDGPRLYADNLLVLRAIWFDKRKPKYGYTLSGVLAHIEPPEEIGFPFRMDRAFVYFQVWGDPGDYRFRLRVVRIEAAEGYDEEDHEIQIGANGEVVEFPMPTQRPFEVSGLNYVDEIAFPFGPVRFEPGVYEFQVWADGIDYPIARERLLARRN